MLVLLYISLVKKVICRGDILGYALLLLFVVNLTLIKFFLVIW